MIKEKVEENLLLSTRSQKYIFFVNILNQMKTLLYSRSTSLSVYLLLLDFSKLPNKSNNNTNNNANNNNNINNNNLSQLPTKGLI